jgi:hypothetical protein
MGLKITLITGEVVELDVDDYLEMDNSTNHGRAAIQDVLNFRDQAKKWNSTDLAESEDEMKFLDDIKIKDVSLEEFEEDIYKESLKNQDLI